MHSESAIPPPAFPVAAIAPERVGAPPAQAAPGVKRQTILGKAISVLRGDKYMAGAYPPEWPASSTRPDPAASAAPDRAVATDSGARR